jgi:hypothetical protein
MCRACGVKKLALVNHPSYPAVVQGSCKRKPELQKKHDFENNISRLSHDLWFNSQLRNSHRAQDCTIKSVRTMRLNLPEKLDTISKNWAKVAGHQLHPSSWHTTLQANLAGEREKKIRAASSSTPQTAQRPFAGPLLAATFKLGGRWSRAICQEKILILSGTRAAYTSLKWAMDALWDILAYIEPTEYMPDWSSTHTTLSCPCDKLVFSIMFKICC